MVISNQVYKTLFLEAIAFSTNRKKTLHVTFFYLADAFGSVSHSLSKSMKQFHLPEKTISRRQCARLRLERGAITFISLTLFDENFLLNSRVEKMGEMSGKV